MARVIKADEIGTLGAAKATVLNLKDLASQARQIVLDARREAATILARARKESQLLHQQTLDEAHQQGLAQGRKEGLAQGLQRGAATAADQARGEMADLTELARQIVGELSAARDRMHADLKREMLEFSLALAAKIVGQVAVSDIAAAQANLAKVLELAGRNGEIVIKVNPKQLRRLQDHAQELLAPLGVQGPVRVVGDEEISMGGVKLLSRCGEIDATIETQLANVAHTLVGGIGNLFNAPQNQQGTYVGEADQSAHSPQPPRAAIL